MTYTFTEGELLTAALLNEHCVNQPPPTTKQKGLGVTVPSGSGGTNVNITFDVPFDSEPAIFLQVDHPALGNPRVTGKTMSGSQYTGFTARFDRASSAVYHFDWLADI